MDEARPQVMGQVVRGLDVGHLLLLNVLLPMLPNSVISPSRNLGHWQQLPLQIPFITYSAV